MTDAQRRAAAKQFTADWANRGNEKQETRTSILYYVLGDIMEQLIEAVSENFNAILSGFFVLAGTFLGWFLNQLAIMYQDKPRLVFAAVGTPNDELIEVELRTKTSPSEWSIRICNIGKTACLLEKFYIVRKGYTLVECYDVCSDYNSIAPSNSILYSLMQQDADALQDNYSEHYKSPNELYLRTMRLLGNMPVIRNCIVEPLFRQGECEVIAYTINGKRIRGKIDWPLLYIRHTAKDSIVEV